MIGVTALYVLFQVDALSQKRIIAFFNEFVCQAVTFLNNFSSVCEDKLLKVETRLERMETILQILESKVRIAVLA